MSSYEKRISALEDAFKTHLIESGEIRGDLKWLKKMIWFVLGSPVIVELVMYILRGNR